ncbi:MAG TPA: NAD(P)H-dependent oxidoreductase [Burkholderiales bacterium]|nr:NAD(P)H-dependent oxidoreductase [Burkholderiales bacterium]
MNALVVVANPSRASFSHAMAGVARGALVEREYRILFHDLFAEDFPPVHGGDALVERHRGELQAADLVLVFHPNWWGSPPAILKGWIDRVFCPGVAYEYPPGVGPAGVPKGLLRARCGLVFNTSETPWERELAVFGNPLERTWRDGVFAFCGVERFERAVYGPMSTSTAAMRERWLGEVRSLVEKHA